MLTAWTQTRDQFELEQQQTQHEWDKEIGKREVESRKLIYNDPQTHLEKWLRKDQELQHQMQETVRMYYKVKFPYIDVGPRQDAPESGDMTTMPKDIECVTFEHFEEVDQHSEHGFIQRRKLEEDRIESSEFVEISNGQSPPKRQHEIQIAVPRSFKTEIERLNHQKSASSLEAMENEDVIQVDTPRNSRNSRFSTITGHHSQQMSDMMLSNNSVDSPQSSKSSHSNASIVEECVNNLRELQLSAGESNFSEWNQKDKEISSPSQKAYSHSVPSKTDMDKLGEIQNVLKSLQAANSSNTKKAISRDNSKRNSTLELKPKEEGQREEEMKYAVNQKREKSPDLQHEKVIRELFEFCPDAAAVFPGEAASVNLQFKKMKEELAELDGDTNPYLKILWTKLML